MSSRTNAPRDARHVPRRTLAQPSVAPLADLTVFGVGASAVQTLVEQAKAEITSGIGTKRRCFSRSPSTTVTMWGTGADDGLSLVLRQLRAAFITLRVGLHRADSQWRHLPELDDQARGKRAQEIDAEREGSDQRGRGQLQAKVGLPRDGGCIRFQNGQGLRPCSAQSRARVMVEQKAEITFIEKQMRCAYRLRRRKLFVRFHSGRFGQVRIWDPGGRSCSIAGVRSRTTPAPTQRSLPRHLPWWIAWKI